MTEDSILVGISLTGRVRTQSLVLTRNILVFSLVKFHWFPTNARRCQGAKLYAYLSRVLSHESALPCFKGAIWGRGRFRGTIKLPVKSTFVMDMHSSESSGLWTFWSEPLDLNQSSIRHIHHFRCPPSDCRSGSPISVSQMLCQDLESRIPLRYQMDK